MSAMTPFTCLTSVAAPLAEANVDTDIIFPARFLLITAKAGLGRYAFYERRYGSDGSEDPDFVLNQPAFQGAQILVAGDNFGCGSSREHAPWALKDLGFRCIVSSGFGEIFAGNCYGNGMLPLVAPPEELPGLLADAQARVPFAVDLEAQTLARPGRPTLFFDLPAWRKAALMNGWDEIDVVMAECADAIDAFETRQRAAQPWLYAGEN